MKAHLHLNDSGPLYTMKEAMIPPLLHVNIDTGLNKHSNRAFYHVYPSHNDFKAHLKRKYTHISL